MSSTAVVRVGCGCVVQSPDHPGQVLVGKRKGSHGAGKIAFPGGHLELGESWEDCLLREVKEETNLDIDDFSFVHVTNDPDIDGNREKHYITIFLRATIKPDSAELTNMEPHKCESWGWMDWTDIVNLRETEPERLFEPMRHLVDGLNAQGKTPFL